ncbi:BEL1-like homeodomain protein 1 [Humulus lupulus]|uniref:BEL1-like homeodomain protein 1 n=1 Tax=Humulus lupulus TaxID=3486 RepID=UPI002B4076E3|nr:BEL1-like homeodomain protein 1 [Humulus lupulus]XP_062082461.1 BEL1-like homeodomain protein 1 [Humulus lupulus]
MATYFNHGSSEIQGPDGLHTLYLMNPNNYVQTYSDSTTSQPPPPHPAANMFLLNPNQLQQHHHSRHLTGVPISSAGANAVPGSNSDDISAFAGTSTTPSHLQYNIWGSMDHHNQRSVGISSADFASQMGFRRQVVSPTQQALSLSLSSTHPQAAYAAASLSGEIEVVPTMLPTGGHDSIRSFAGNSLSSTVSNNGIGTSGQLQSVLLGSKYLKAAQELLDEVVKVGSKGGKDAVDSANGASKDKAMKSYRESTPPPEMGGSRNSGGESSSSKISAELSTVQRQELQVKKAKLASMLDEVEQRYRQYHQQMNVVISSFEQAVGFGSAKSYTALALKTISKQFRCLKDAISAQIKATSKTLGEEECLGVKIEGSRLRFVDHHLRQQRALQQLGMMPHNNNNAWRPQRGLPERAVSVLRAWLFEHFLHPYPKTADKVMLAKQTGLTRSQVSNWFINARVRLWKPMVEEMYIEETKGHEDQLKGINNANKNDANKESTTGAAANSTADDRSNNAFQYSKSDHNHLQKNHSSADQISSSSFSTTPMGRSFHGSPKKPRSTTTNSEVQNSSSSILSIGHMDMMKGSTDQYNRPDNVAFGRSERQISTYPVGFGTYQVGDLGRFHSRDHHDHELMAPSLFHGNAVSLTLGLPHCENHTLSSETAQQSFLSNPQNIDPLFD